MMQDNATAVISDVHSNLEALEAVLGDIRKQNIKNIISLGDIVGYGASPNEVIKLFIKQNIESVRGNHDAAIFFCEEEHKEFNNHAHDAIERTKCMLSEESKKYLKSLKDFLVIGGVRFVHGCPPDSYKDYVPDYVNERNAFRMFEEDLCFIGHTHRAIAYFSKKIEEGATLRSEDFDVDRVAVEPNSSLAVRKDERAIFNPGSVGQPREKRLIYAKYFILYNDNNNEKEIEFRHIPYDIEKSADKIRKIMKDDSLAEMLYGSASFSV
ncbi:MAG: metallophosphoesterase family protein [Candidatus Woesearchaeota archaeon]|nr:metallophosphoesterase family protein [Candidatus Woesearchaeota archaeon]